jgi:hypothetical protein
MFPKKQEEIIIKDVSDILLVTDQLVGLPTVGEAFMEYVVHLNNWF